MILFMKGERIGRRVFSQALRGKGKSSLTEEKKGGERGGTSRVKLYPASTVFLRERELR